MKITALILGLFSSSLVFSQSFNGYYGKRNYIDVVSVNYSPLVYNLFRTSTAGFNDEDGEFIRSRRSWFNTGVHFSVGRAIKNNLALGFEYGADFKKVFAPYIYYGQPGDDFWGAPYFPDAVVHEDITVIRHVFLPKIEFSHPDALLPMGLSYTVGLGITMSKVIQKEYLIGFSYEDVFGDITYGNLPEDVELTSADLIDYSKNFYGIQVMGAIRMRTPLTSYLLLNYGVRYMLNIKLSNDYGYTTESALHHIISSSNGTNFISLDVGLTVPF